MKQTRTGGRILVDQLVQQGVERVFCVPGESYLPVLDALHDCREIEVITCRQEGGAAMMAEAHGKLTGTPGVCLVTRGPGASNASIGVHIARQDSTPMLLLIGQVARDQRDREAFQEVDLVAMFRPLAKWAGQIDAVERIPEYMSRAWHLACNGRPGPVVLILPEDMLKAAASVIDRERALRPQPYPDPAAIEQLTGRLAEARAPLIVLGATTQTERSRSLLEAWAERNSVPVVTAFRCQDAFDNGHPAYWGHAGLAMDPQLVTAIKEADLLVLLDARLDAITSAGYTLLTGGTASVQRRVHVYPDATEIGVVDRPDLAIQSNAEGLLRALADMESQSTPDRERRLQRGHKRYLEFSEPTALDTPLDPAAVFASLRAALPDDAILCNGAGNYTIWLHRYYRYRRIATQLAPRAGSMGYGLPAAIAAKALDRSRTVVAVAGDGCLLMTVQELATALQHDLAIIVIVFNNAGYGTIRMHQERHYPGRPVATALTNPDFVVLARAFGLQAWQALSNDEFDLALQQAMACGQPALIELKIDPRVIAPGSRLKSGGGIEPANHPR